MLTTCSAGVRLTATTGVPTFRPGDFEPGLPGYRLDAGWKCSSYGWSVPGQIAGDEVETASAITDTLQRSCLCPTGALTR